MEAQHAWWIILVQLDYRFVEYQTSVEDERAFGHKLLPECIQPQHRCIPNDELTGTIPHCTPRTHMSAQGEEHMYMYMYNVISLFLMHMSTAAQLDNWNTHS